MEFLTLDEYWTQARKIISNHNCNFLLKDDDAVSYVAHRMMVADQTWNGKSSRRTWRYDRAHYAILRLLYNRKKNKQYHIKSLDWELNDQESSFINLLEDKRDLTNKIAEDFNHICDYAKNVLSGRQLECFQMYYQDGMTLEDIGRKLGTTRQNISLHVQKGTAKLKKCLLQQN
jgi:RNA polymerase sigma factor (sigma-70 family)